jgi:hypothetical protein
VKRSGLRGVAGINVGTGGNQQANDLCVTVKGCEMVESSEISKKAANSRIAVARVSIGVPPAAVANSPM